MGGKTGSSWANGINSAIVTGLNAAVPDRIKPAIRASGEWMEKHEPPTIPQMLGISPADNAAAAVKQARAHGGHVHHMHMKKPHKIKMHTGAIHSAVAGRTDHLPMHVPSGSYVIPADIISALGEGNTVHGFKVAKNIFSAPFYGSGTPYGASGLPYGAPSPHKAGGGSAEVPIVAAGGEYVIAPHEVQHIGRGSMDDGHKILDEFVKQARAKTIKTLKSLPGPRKN